MIKRTALIIAALFIYAANSTAQTKIKAIDYLTVAGPLNFDKKAYFLDWSSNPAVNFYKQEYLAKGEITGQYNTMLLIDAVVTTKSVAAVAAEKIEELKKMKATNPMVNYESFNNPTTGEYMIDFLLSAYTANDNLSIVERNVYRYKAFTDKSGKKGVLLFGVSKRSYGNNIDSFLKALKVSRSELVTLVSKFTLPAVVVKK
jgi:hypothetical protein